MLVQPDARARHGVKRELVVTTVPVPMTRQSKITGSAMAAVPSRASPAPITNSRVSIFFRKCVFIFLLYQRGAIVFLLHRFRASIRRSLAVRKWVEPYRTLGLRPQYARLIDPNVWQGGQASTHIRSEHSLQRLRWVGAPTCRYSLQTRLTIDFSGARVYSTGQPKTEVPGEKQEY